MFLVELVMQGVRGFEQLVRVRFQGGFNFIAAGNEAGKTTSVDTVQRLLFPINQPSRMETLMSRAVPDGSRGALVVYSDDTSYYRIIQDFSKGAVNLSKFNPGPKDFTLMHKDWDSTAQFMTGLLPGISEEDFARVFVFRRGSCSGQSGITLAVATAPMAPPKPKPVAPAAKDSGRETRLAELRETLHKAEESADAEYKLEAAKLRLVELAKKLEIVDGGSEKAAELDEQIASLQACADLPENLDDLIRAHEDQEQQAGQKADDLRRDIESLTMQVEGMPQANLMTDKLFLSGAVMGVLSIIAGLFILEQDEAIFFPLGILVALGLIAAGWYTNSRKTTQRKLVQKEIDGLEDELAGMGKTPSGGGAAIVKYMKAVGAATTAELKDKADNYRYFRSLREDLDQQRSMALSGLDADGIRADYAKQEAEIGGLAETAKSLSKYAVDIYSVRQEIERIESEQGSAGHEIAAFADDMVSDFSAAVPMSAGQPMNFLADIALASRVSGVEIETLVPAVEAAAQRNLATTSNGKYVRVEVGPDGQPLVHDRNNATVAFAGLSHGAREMVCFCLRAGIVEAIAGKRRLPFILDDPFTGMDPARQMAACQVLRTLGAKTQVILLTSNPTLKMPTDIFAELK